VRIVAGSRKGHRIAAPKGAATRPTGDRVREAVFSIIGPVEGAAVLDLFAGSGALGLEAISRGARHATFVESDPRALRVLRENVALCGVENACTMVRDDVLGFAERHPGMAAFDLILLDPPYDFRQLDAALAEAGGVLAPGGLIVLEHSRRREPPAAPDHLAHRRTVTAGDSALAFYDYV